MDPTKAAGTIVRAGDLDGLGTVYSEEGRLIKHDDEEILRSDEGWELDIVSPWRRVLPKTIFSGFAGKTASRLYVTTNRIVLIREIDVFREIKSELTPLGLPSAAAKEIHLKKLKSVGARQYCEIWPRGLRVVKQRRVQRRWSLLELRLLGTDGRQYGIAIWKAGSRDDETLALIESRFAE